MKRLRVVSDPAAGEQSAGIRENGACWGDVVEIEFAAKLSI